MITFTRWTVEIITRLSFLPIVPIQNLNILEGCAKIRASVRQGKWRHHYQFNGVISSSVVFYSCSVSMVAIISISESSRGEPSIRILSVSDAVDDWGPISSITRHESSSSDSTSDEVGLKFYFEYSTSRLMLYLSITSFKILSMSITSSVLIFFSGGGVLGSSSRGFTMTSTFGCAITFSGTSSAASSSDPMDG